MRTLKVIIGCVCLIAALPVCLYAWLSIVYGPLFFKPIFAIYAIGILGCGICLIRNREGNWSKKVKVWMVMVSSFLILAPAVTVICIRHNRHLLQERAKRCLEQPIPKAVEGDVDGLVGLYYVGQGEDALKRSHMLIKRFADKGRIRWSAVIQGQFAMSGIELSSCEAAPAVKTNEAARTYVARCKAILDDEWQMGFWQGLEDAIEFRAKIPEIEEENSHSAR
jgi:hypothetical protein